MGAPPNLPLQTDGRVGRFTPSRTRHWTAISLARQSMNDDLRIRNRKPAILIGAGLLVFGFLVFAVQYPSYKRAKESVRQHRLESARVPAAH